MKIRNLFLTFLATLIFSLSLIGQNISGSWQGVLSQEVGSTVTYYPFLMTLNQNDTGISRTSEITISDSDLFANMTLSGSYDGTEFQYQENEIVD